MVGTSYATFTGSVTFISYLNILIEMLLNIFTLLCAFLVTKIELRFINGLLNRKSREKIIKRMKTPFKDLIFSLVIVLVLLILSAVF